MELRELRVKNESGSTYILNPTKMTWDRERQSPDPESPFPVRTKGGKLNVFPTPKVGQSMIMAGPSLTPGGTVRLIETSLVLEVEEVNDPGPPIPMRTPPAMPW